MDVAPLASKILPARGAARQAAARVATQLQDSDSESDKGSSAVTKKRAPGSQRKAKEGLRRGGGKGVRSQGSSTRPPVTSALTPLGQSSRASADRPRSQQQTTAAGKKRRLSSESLLSEEEGEDGGLLFSTLSSPTVSRSQRSLIDQRRQPPPPPLSQSTPTLRHSTVFAENVCRDESSWERPAVGSHVWILIDRNGIVLEPSPSGGIPVERVWWPGKVMEALSQPSLSVKVYGEPASRIHRVMVSRPCSANILSILDKQGRRRFEAPTFVQALPPENDTTASPRKKLKVDKIDISERWLKAMAALLEEKAKEDDDNDELPEVSVAYSYADLIPSLPDPGRRESSSGSENGKARKRANSKLKLVEEIGWETGFTEETLDDFDWPPGPDDSLRIPGELVFARDPNGTYWPTKVLEYIPPTRKTEKHGKYRVVYLDGVEGVIVREWFFSSDEDSFVTCQLGKWESQVNEVPIDQESELDQRLSVGRGSHGPSPAPRDPPPKTEDFVELDVREQFVYAKPVLQAILQDDYPPARARHLGFLAGGSSRREVVKEAGLRGQMDPNDVEHLQRLLSRWCLKGHTEKIGPPTNLVADTDEHENAEDLVPVFGLGEGGDTVFSGATDTNFNAPQDASRKSPSPAATDCVDPSSSPPELPPSSSFAPSETHSSEVDSSVFEDLKSATTSKFHPFLDDDSGSDLTQLDTDSEKAVSEPPQSSRFEPCEEFATLVLSDKLDYCVNVLLPEAIIQLLLWRTGERTSARLLSMDEEYALHQKGKELLKETDWVFDVMRLREAKGRRKQVNNKSSTRPESNGRSSRPKRNVGVLNYQE